jgi:hypothetical protein
MAGTPSDDWYAVLCHHCEASARFANLKQEELPIHESSDGPGASHAGFDPVTKRFSERRQCSNQRPQGIESERPVSLLQERSAEEHHNNLATHLGVIKR